jgi:hypothetical protein
MSAAFSQVYANETAKTPAATGLVDVFADIKI